MYLNTRIFPTTGYARVLLFMFIRRELGGTGTGCLFQFAYCEYDDTRIRLGQNHWTIFHILFMVRITDKHMGPIAWQKFKDNLEFKL